MKRIILPLPALALFALMTFDTYGQQQVPLDMAEQNAAKIEGIWEFRGTRTRPDADFRRPPVTILKILSGDGVINNLAVTPKGSVITASGTYTVESDSTYVEHILQAHHNLAIDNKDVRLFYKIKDDKQLYLRFSLENNSLGQAAPATYEELWIRVGVPDAEK